MISDLYLREISSEDEWVVGRPAWRCSLYTLSSAPVPEASNILHKLSRRGSAHPINTCPTSITAVAVSINRALLLRNGRTLEQEAMQAVMSKPTDAVDNTGIFENVSFDQCFGSESGEG